MPVTQNSILFVLYVAVIASFIGTTCWNRAPIDQAQRGQDISDLFFIFASAMAIVLVSHRGRLRRADQHLAATFARVHPVKAGTGNG